MNNAVKVKLQEILLQYGRTLIEDADRTEGYLRDFCGEARAEIAVLLAALREGVPEDLSRLPDDQPRQLQAASMARRLVDHQAMDQNAARWAVDAWAFALGIDLGASPSPTVPVLPGESVNPTPPGGAQHPAAESGGPYTWGSTPISQPELPNPQAQTGSGKGDGLFRSRSGKALIGVGVAIVLGMALWKQPAPEREPGPTGSSTATAGTPTPGDPQSDSEPGVAPSPAPKPQSVKPSAPRPRPNSSPLDDSPRSEGESPSRTGSPQIQDGNAARASVSIGVPQIRHNVWLGGNPRPVLGMLIWLPGTTSHARGRSVQLVARFAFADGRMLYANANEPRLRDSNGLLATATPRSTIMLPQTQLADNALQMSLPYYALSLRYTPVTYQLLVTVSVYLDDVEVARSQPLAFTLSCGGPGAGICL
jgi:hypothetical protein